MLCPAETGIVGRNPSMPALELLFSPGILHRKLCEKGVLDPGSSLEIDYLRYKPGDNCVARLACEQHGLEVFGYAKAYGANAEAKLGKAAERESLPGVLGIGRIQFPELKLEVNFLPNDNALSSLGRLDRGAGQEALLTRIFKGNEAWRGAGYTVLSYKPERRLTALFSRPAGPAAVVKLKTAPRYAQSRYVHKRLLEVPGIRMPTLMGWSGRHHALAFRWLEGESLASPLRRGDTSQCRAAGSAIARFHQSRHRGLRSSEERRSPGDLMILAEGLAEILPEASEMAGRLAGEVEGWWLHQAARSSPVHGDFYPDQVIVSGDSLGLIDFDEARKGHPLEDLGSFLARLEMNALEQSVRPSVAAAAIMDFLEGYRSRTGGQLPEMLNRFVAISLFRLSHHPFRSRAADWPALTESLLQRCSSIWSDGGYGR